MISTSKPWKFIVVEGVDGVGKTSVCKALSFALEAHYYKTPPPILETFYAPNSFLQGVSLRRYIDNMAYQSPHARFLFYLFGLVLASIEIKELLNIGHVVCDRYLSSTLAYHWTLHQDLEWVDTSWLPIVRPDYQFLLIIDDESEHSRRLKSRNTSSCDQVLENNFTYLRKVQEKFRSFDLVEIDTDKSTIEEIVDRLSSEVFCGYSMTA